MSSTASNDSGPWTKQMDEIPSKKLEMQDETDANSQPTNNKQFEYFAFISYSHDDSRIARWLHRQLNWYRYPNELVAPSIRPPHPHYVRPVIRDKTDLESERGTFWARIQQKLDSSRYLIVFCSPTAAQSKFVNMEVEHFLRTHNLTSVLPVVVRGNPGSDDDMECLPPILRIPAVVERSLPTTVLEEGEKERESWERGLIRIVSYLLNVHHDKLRSEYETIRRRTFQRALAATCVGLLLFAAITFWAIIAERKSRQEASVNAELSMLSTSYAQHTLDDVFETASGLFGAEKTLETMARNVNQYLGMLAEIERTQAAPENLALLRAHTLVRKGQILLRQRRLQEGIVPLQEAIVTLRDPTQCDPMSLPVRRLLLDASVTLHTIGQKQYNKELVAFAINILQKECENSETVEVPCELMLSLANGWECLAAESAKMENWEETHMRMMRAYELQKARIAATPNDHTASRARIESLLYLADIAIYQRHYDRAGAWLNDLSESSAELTRALPFNRDCQLIRIRAFLIRGKLHLFLRQTDQGIRELDEGKALAISLLSISPRDAEVQNLLSSVYHMSSIAHGMRGDLKQCEHFAELSQEAIQEAARLDESNLDVRLRALRAQQESLAAQALRKSPAEVAAEYRNMLNKLQQLREQVGPEALSALTQGWHDWASILQERGSLTEAEEAGRKAVALARELNGLDTNVAVELPDLVKLHLCYATLFSIVTKQGRSDAARLLGRQRLADASIAAMRFGTDEALEFVSTAAVTLGVASQGKYFPNTCAALNDAIRLLEERIDPKRSSIRQCVVLAELYEQLIQQHRAGQQLDQPNDGQPTHEAMDHARLALKTGTQQAELLASLIERAPERQDLLVTYANVTRSARQDAVMLEDNDTARVWNAKSIAAYQKAWQCDQNNIVIRSRYTAELTWAMQDTQSRGGLSTAKAATLQYKTLLEWEYQERPSVVNCIAVTETAYAIVNLSNSLNETDIALRHAHWAVQRCNEGLERWPDNRKLLTIKVSCLCRLAELAPEEEAVKAARKVLSILQSPQGRDIKCTEREQLAARIAAGTQPYDDTAVSPDSNSIEQQKP